MSQKTTNNEPSSVDIKKKVIKLVSGNLFSTGLSAIFGIYVARMLGPENRGLLALMTAAAVLMSSIFSFGVAHAAAYFVRNQPDSARTILNLITIMSVGLIPITAIIVFVTRDTLGDVLWARQYLSDYAAGWVVIYSTLSMAVSMLSVCVIAKGDSTRFSMATILGWLVTIVITFFGLATTHKAFESVLTGYLAGSIMSLYMMRRTYSNYMTHSESNVSYRHIVQFGLKIYVASISSLVFKKIDVYIVGAFLSISAVGHYAVALSLRDFGLSVARAVAGIVGGELSAKETAAKRKIHLIKKSLLHVSGISIALAIVAYAVFPFLIPLVYGKAYLATIEPAVILMVSAIFLSGAIVYGAANVAAGAPLMQSMGNLLIALLGVLILWVGVASKGLMGVAWANVLICILAMAVQFSIYYWLARREEK